MPSAARRGPGVGRLPLVAVLALLGGIAALDLVAAGWIAATLGPGHRPVPAVPGGLAAASPAIGGAASATPPASALPSASAAVPPAAVVPVATTAPTPLPTALPSQASAGGPTPPPVTADPAQAILAFYHAVALHQWSAATALWTPSMQQRYPPDEYIVARFTPTTQITIRNLGTLSSDPAAGRATVGVTVIEQRTLPPNPLVSTGSWDLVAVDGRWLLDQPHF